VVTYKQDGFDPQSIPVEVKPAKDHTVDAELKPATGSICGTVNGTTGPLGGVTIAAAGPGKAETKTVDAGDATTPPGSFWLTGLPTPGAYALTFTADGYEPQTIAITLQPGETKSALTVTLIPTGGGTPVTALAAPPTSDPVPTPTPTPTTGDASAAESHTPKGAEAPAPQPTKTTSPQRPAAPPSGSSHPPPRRNQPDPPPGRGWPLPGQLAR
jgi:hypothetical protein